MEQFDERLWTLLDDMAETMYAADGVGIAGVQVGVLRRVFVVDIGEGLTEFINPTITAASRTGWRAAFPPPANTVWSSARKRSPLRRSTATASPSP